MKVGLNGCQVQRNLAPPFWHRGRSSVEEATETRNLFMESAPLMLGLRLLPALIPTGTDANLTAGVPVRQHFIELREVQLTPGGAADMPSARPVSSKTAATC